MTVHGGCTDLIPHAAAIHLDNSCICMTVTYSEQHMADTWLMHL